MNPYKKSRLDRLMQQDHIDAILCRLPENIVYLTGTQPVHGASAVFYMPGQKPALLQPECESQWVETDRCELVTFPWGHLGDTDLTGNYTYWLTQLAGKYCDSIQSLGLELDFSVAAPAYSSAEYLFPDRAWFSLVAKCFPAARILDTIPVISSARSIKDTIELACLRRSNQIAELGLETLNRSIQAGMSEVQAAALVESTIRVEGTGYKGTSLVKAYAQVTSGPQGTFQQSMLTPSGQRQFQNGDLVMIELAVCADGYWSDLTRVYCVGQPNQEQVRIYNTVLAAQQAAADKLRPGNTWGSPDKAARDLLTQAGLGAYFKHGTGHGVGYRYHETIPQLGPDNQAILEEGMVTSVEPGVYLPDFGGIRIEDNIAVGSDGPIWLSTCCSPWG